MRSAWILGLALTFLAAAGFAETPSQATYGAAIFGQQVTSGACAAGPGRVVFAGKDPGPLALCNATANCASGTVSCSGNSTCQAVDRNCGVCERGHVTCDGVTTLCPTTCTGCGGGGCGFCCQCDQTGDCFACCRCGGGTTGNCALQC